MPKLQISVPNIGDVTHELTGDELSLGRSASNKIQIKDGSVSIFHARLFRQDDTFVLEDLGSTNGTYVNGAQITRQNLDQSAALRFGNIAAFFHRDPVSSGRTAEPPPADMRKLQSQVASLREARDLIHARNEALLRERDAATEAADLAAAEAVELKAKVAVAPDPETLRAIESKLEEQRTQVLALINIRQELETKLAEATDARKAETARQAEAGQTQARLEAELAEAARQREDAQRQLEGARESAASHQRQREDIEKQLAERESGRSGLEQELEDLRQAKAAAHGELETTRAQLQEARRKSDEVERERQEARTQLEVRTGELEKARGEMKMLHGEIEGDLAERRGDLEERGRRLAALEADKQSLEQKLAHEHEAVSSSGREAQQAQADLQNLRRELEEARSQGEILAKECETLRHQQQAMVGQLDEHQAARAAVAQTSDGLAAELDQVRSQLAAAEAERDQLRHQQTAQTQSAEEFAAEKTRLIEKMGAFENERNQLARAVQDARAAAGDLPSLRQRLEAAEKAAAAENERAGRLERELSSRQSSAEDQKSKNEAIGREVQTLRESANALEKERDQESIRLDQTEAELRALTKSSTETIGQLRRDRDKAHADLDAAMQRLTVTDETFQSQLAEIDALHQRIEAMEAAFQNPPAAPSGDSVDDPFFHGRGGAAKAETARGLRPRRAGAKIEQRMQHRLDADSPGADSPGETGERAEKGSAIDRPLWIGRKQNPAAPRRDEPMVFPDEVVAEDCQTLAKFPGVISEARGDLQYLIRHPSDLACLENLRQRTRTMAGTARSTVFRAVYTLTSALEGLLGDLHGTPERINQGTLRTVSQTFDFLSQLVEPGRMRETLGLAEPHVLAIDDEPDVLDAIVSALELAGLPASGSGDPQAAIEALAREKFDLVFIDVRLPEVTGWDVGQKIRNLPGHRRTPIIFVTGMDSIENKVKSTLQGGNDFVGKPFHIRELGLKGLTWVYRGQLGML